MSKAKQKLELTETSMKPQYIGSVVSDIMGAFMIPGGSIVSEAIQQVFKKRLDAAREILLEEIGSGYKDMSDAAKLEEVAAIIYRYGRAAQEGAARVNLRLLSQVIANKKFSEEPAADKFLYYADILASLKLEEVTLLGIMIRERASKDFTSSKESTGYEETVQSLLRTGLVAFEQSISVEDQTDWKSGQKYESKLHTGYYLTSLMDDVCNYISFDDALRKEGVEVV